MALLVLLGCLTIIVLFLIVSWFYDQKERVTLLHDVAKLEQRIKALESKIAKEE